ncbi:hypothetical protein H1P_3020004 [Hyella patelloides LEGE 07179]|uniref:Uncharacterized protein n=1 Tax=Hyella patelloides LEGE 07179 TaxID=945734 RepID=A0A563VUA5_9CYAN|nr:hypothetical protein H1P_3020004 [Hyella patelloides LEGE 07179]
MVASQVDFSSLASETVAKIDIYPFSQEFLVYETAQHRASAFLRD